MVNINMNIVMLYDMVPRVAGRGWQGWDVNLAGRADVAPVPASQPVLLLAAAPTASSCSSSVPLRAVLGCGSRSCRCRCLR
jgi:hypothetical protein